jgi:hypothetical protein
MFEPIELSHDGFVKWMRSSLKSVNLERVRNAFLVSLSTRRLELRSALGSFAVVKNFPNHVYHGDNYCCAICGGFKNSKTPYDLSVLNFERYKWGGVRHAHLEYIAFDLEQFTKLEKSKPSEQDYSILHQIIEIARHCDPSARPRDLEKRLANVIKSNKAEREILIQILAYCGILQPKKYPGYFKSFPRYFERTIPPVKKIDWTYPICWWRGADGVNQDALKYYFPQLV